MVLEPDPNNQPGGTLTSSYTYDWMNHVTQVAMTRGSTTQYRTFVYDNSGRLTSATNPENGTVTYTYNSDNTLQDKHDAKGQDTVYTYDSKKRVTMVQRYPSGKNNGEDTWQRVTYSYDTNPGECNDVFPHTLTADACDGCSISRVHAGVAYDGDRDVLVPSGGRGDGEELRRRWARGYAV